MWSTLDLQNEVSTNHHRHEDITYRNKINQEEFYQTLHSRKILKNEICKFQI